MSDTSLQRIMARWDLDRRDLLALAIFGFGHPSVSPTRLIHDFVRGIGPAAIARGVAGTHRRPARSSPALAALPIAA